MAIFDVDVTARGAAALKCALSLVFTDIDADAVVTRYDTIYTRPVHTVFSGGRYLYTEHAACSEGEDSACLSFVALQIQQQGYPATFSHQ